MFQRKFKCPRLRELQIQSAITKVEMSKQENLVGKGRPDRKESRFGTILRRTTSQEKLSGGVKPGTDQIQPVQLYHPTDTQVARKPKGERNQTELSEVVKMLGKLLREAEEAKRMFGRIQAV